MVGRIFHLFEVSRDTTPRGEQIFWGKKETKLWKRWLRNYVYFPFGAQHHLEIHAYKKKCNFNHLAGQILGHSIPWHPKIPLKGWTPIPFQHSFRSWNQAVGEKNLPTPWNLIFSNLFLRSVRVRSTTSGSIIQHFCTRWLLYHVGWALGFVLLGRGNEAKGNDGTFESYLSWKSPPFRLQKGWIKQFTQTLQFLQSFDFDLMYFICVLYASCEFFADREGQIDQDFSASPRAKGMATAKPEKRCFFVVFRTSRGFFWNYTT